MKPLMAEEILRERSGSLSARELFDLTLLATDDRDAAEEAFNERVLAELRAGRTPSV